MKKRLLSLALAAALTLSCLPAAETQAASGSISMYRMYNYHTGEHFYTKNASERNSLLVAGWDYEGIGWTAPASGKNVYRLYNKNAGDHHYTTSAKERDALTRLGWKYEGVGWKSDISKAVPLYRAYNPNAKTGTHNYTASKGENDSLVRLGWRAEGIGWYGVHSPAKGSSNVPDGRYYVELTTGENAMDPVGYIQNLSAGGKEMSFTGQIYRTGSEYMTPYGGTRNYRFRFADDCLYYLQPTDIAPRQLISGNQFLSDSEEAWQDSEGSNSQMICLNVQNGYVTYAYETW